jgi:hypothetical protein
MERIIAGRFQTKDGADAVVVLIAQCVDTTDICIFQNNPAGQHGALPSPASQSLDTARRAMP